MEPSGSGCGNGCAEDDFAAVRAVASAIQFSEERQRVLSTKQAPLPPQPPATNVEDNKVDAKKREEHKAENSNVSSRDVTPVGNTSEDTNKDVRSDLEPAKDIAGNLPAGEEHQTSPQSDANLHHEEVEELVSGVPSRFLEICMEGEVEDLAMFFEELVDMGENGDEEPAKLLASAITAQELNYRDQAGRTGISHICSNGAIEMLELLDELELSEADYNLPDNDGNAPLHHGAQAGHVDVVSFLLNRVQGVQVDPCNALGFTPLMKAALQGRIKCSKMLLFAGANAEHRDPGRGLTAAQWARYCGRVNCADAIDKFMRASNASDVTATVMGHRNSNNQVKDDSASMKKRGKFLFSGFGSKKRPASADGRHFPSHDSSSESRSSPAKWLSRKFRGALHATSSSPSRLFGRRRRDLPEVQVTLEPEDPVVDDDEEECIEDYFPQRRVYKERRIVF